MTTQDQPLSPKRLTSVLSSLPAGKKRHKQFRFSRIPTVYLNKKTSILLQKSFYLKAAGTSPLSPEMNMSQKVRKNKLPPERVDSKKCLKQPKSGISFVSPNSPADHFFPRTGTAPSYKN